MEGRRAGPWRKRGGTALRATDGRRPLSEVNADVPVWILDPATTAPPERCAAEGETRRINEMRPLHRFSFFSSLHIPTENRTSLGPLVESGEMHLARIARSFVLSSSL